MSDSPLLNALTTDLSCRRCSYNLRGLPTTGACPECGAPVSLALQSDHLRHADPAWLRTLAKGCAILIASALISVPETLSIFAVPFGQPFYLTIRFLQLFSQALDVPAFLLITSAEPGSPDSLRARRRRLLIRAAITAKAAHTILSVPMYETPLLQGSATLQWTNYTLGWIVGFASLFAYIALLHDLQRLAARTDAPTLPRNIRGTITLCWTHGAVAALYASTIFLFYLTGSASLPLYQAYTCIRIPTGIIFFLLCLRLISTFARIRTTLLTAAKDADQLTPSPV